MLTKRIIPCLDVLNTGRVVKGINFINLKDAGSPIELAKRYNQEGADELVFLDVNTSENKRNFMINLINKVSKQVFIPFTVGGGIKSIKDIKRVLLAGADKIAINKAAVKNPQLISDGANIFGSQCIVLAIDAKKKESNQWEVYICGGSQPTGIDLFDWINEGTKRGAGEILLTSIDKDGTKQGFDVELMKIVAKQTTIPVIASGGAGKINDFFEVFKNGMADAALAASIFHFKELTIKDIKNFLNRNNIPVRLNYEKN